MSFSIEKIEQHGPLWFGKKVGDIYDYAVMAETLLRLVC